MTQTLPISPTLRTLLEAAANAVQRAVTERDLVLRTVLAAHDVPATARVAVTGLTDDGLVIERAEPAEGDASTSEVPGVLAQ